MKKYLTIMLACIMFIVPNTSVYAEEVGTAEWYELNNDGVSENADEEFTNVIEVMPYAKYLMNVNTTIIKKTSSSVGIRADVFCSEKMSQIYITFYLQKLSGSTWVTVGTGNASASNVASTAKSVTVTGLTGGTYRGKANVKVVDKYGYSETATSFTGGIKVG